MSQFLRLIVPSDVTLEAVHGSLSDGWKSLVVEGRSSEKLHIQASDGSWYVRLSESSHPDEIAAEYALWDDLPEELKRNLGGKLFFSIAYNDSRATRLLLKEILEASASDLAEWWIDGDHGAIVRADILLGHLEADEEWDWRRALRAG